MQERRGGEDGRVRVASWVNALTCVSSTPNSSTRDTMSVTRAPMLSSGARNDVTGESGDPDMRRCSSSVERMSDLAASIAARGA